MVKPLNDDAVTERNFKLLSVAALLTKIRNGITADELYHDAERKFDTLIELLSETYADDSVISNFGYSLEELKKVSLYIFNRLISEANADPFIALCVLEGASMEEVRRRRNKLLHIFHPDRQWIEFNDVSKTRRINEAYESIVEKYSRKETHFHPSKMYVPPSYRYNRKSFDLKLIVFFTLLIALIVFLGLITYLNSY